MDTHQKALQINLDPDLYGTFAEIGAGQEVARWFFRVGGAAGTIAKTMSAYDMTFSDAIYGASERYVSRRASTRCSITNIGLLVERLDAKRGDATRFFVFADTVAAKSFKRQERRVTAGWACASKPSPAVAARRRSSCTCGCWTKKTSSSRRRSGIIGVNLLYGASLPAPGPEALIASLMDDLTSERVEVDMIEFSGPAFARCRQPADEPQARAARPDQRRDVHRRRRSRPAGRSALQESDPRRTRQFPPGHQRHARHAALRAGPVRPGAASAGQEIDDLMEMTLKNLTDGGRSIIRTFSIASTSSAALGKTVLISNYAEYYRLAAYLFRHTKQMIGIVHGRADAAASSSTRSITRTSRAASSSRSAGCSKTT